MTNRATASLSHTLWYLQPAERWVEALPVGNGRLGAMVFGGVAHERLALNEDTLWSGGPRDWANPGALGVLPEVRRLIFAGEYHQADALVKQMQGPYNESYLPLGDLQLMFAETATYSAYRRMLDLDSAVTAVSYTIDDATYTREVFVSAPDQVLVVWLGCDQPGRLSFAATLGSQLRHSTHRANPTGLALDGQCPRHVAPSYLHSEAEPIVYDEPGGEGMTFTIYLQAIAEGGTVRAGDAAIEIAGADTVVLILAARTSYNGYDRSPGRDGLDASVLALADLEAAARKPLAQLRAAHVKDHRGLFRRVALDLGPSPGAGRPTDERLRDYQPGADPQLEALLFQYGRYLLIASSRPGTQPANLQGIWNELVRPPWSANWTININTQMNYWPAEVTHLAECHAPLFDLIEGLSVNGRRTAATNYGCSGWVAHHNADLWRQTAPVGQGGGNPVWANWPMAGVWLCQHLWEHFAFGGDTSFLRERAYPLMKGAAEFCLDWLVEDGQGHLVTAPSVSPEIEFIAPDGQPAAVRAAATMDMALIWDLFGNCISAAQALGIDAQFAAQLEQARARLYSPSIGARGQLQEWADDVLEADVHHRHQSHMFGLHPGRQITLDATPELAAAARRALELRGDAGTGWSMGWKMSLWARLRDGDRAYRLVQQLFNLTTEMEVRVLGGGLYPNLFAAHPPFQIDANFGYTAGVVEMLMQSHAGMIELLPALPGAWPDGSATGLRARGGFEVELRWSGGRLDSASIVSRLGQICRLRASEPLVLHSDGVVVPTIAADPSITVFETVAGGRYTVMPV
jgi:alpha-L-fucosidase 2